MKKITLLGLIIIGMFSSCIIDRSYSSCPTNDRTYFYKQMGVKAPKAFRRGRN